LATTGRQITYVGTDGIETIELVEAQIFGFGDEASRPASGTAVGDVYIVLDTTIDKYRWDVWDGAAWNPIEGRKVNSAATTDPTVNDDSDDGYDVGSIWVNTTDDSVFVCVDSTVGAAVWITVLGVAQHKALRHLIHFIDDGPADGFASGAYHEMLPAGPFPTSYIWWESAAKLKKIVELTITRGQGQRPVTEVWKMYDTDGTTILTTVTDAIVYSGVFETSRTRTIA